MQSSQFTGPKGFVFSLDSAIGIILVVAAIFLLTGGFFETTISSQSSLLTGQDAVFALAKSNYLSQTIDSNTLDQSAALIRQKLLSLVPQNLEARIELKSYSLDADSCRANKNFESCFLQTTPLSAQAGPATPNTETLSSKNLAIIGQNASLCNLDVELSEYNKIFEEKIASFLGQQQQIFFQESGNELGIDFNVTVNPPDVIECDQNVEVTLTVVIPEVTRKPIDVILTIDRSGSMSWTQNLDADNSVQAIYKNGDTTFIADNSAGVRSANTANPLAPTELDQLDPGQVIDVYGEGNYIYLADIGGTDELIAVNATDPSNLIETDQLNFDVVNGLFVTGNYAYVAGEIFNTANRGLVIVDVSNPANIVRRGNLNTTNVQDVFVVGNIAYVADGSAGLRTIDVTNKNALVLRDTVNTAGIARGVFVSGNYAFVADGSGGLVIVDVTDPQNIFITDTVAGMLTSQNVFVTGNYAFVADSAGLQRIDVTDKANAFTDRTYATPVDYLDVWIEGNYAFLAAGGYGLVVLDLIEGPRIENAQDAANSFVDFNGWVLPPDQMGLSAFSTTSTLTQGLTSDTNAMHTAINSLVASGGTNIETGITTANTELTGPNANPQALKFQVVLSDGQSTDGNSQIAAQTSAANGIKIYTIGFGEASPQELIAIAGITGGQYYAATDENALQAVFNLIALQIAEQATDVNVSVPVISGALVLDQGIGNLIDGNIIFQAGDISSGEPWTTTYTLNFPCTSIENCGVDAITLPGDGAKLTYLDSNGVSHEIDFNAQTTLDFHERDLSVQITSGTVQSDSEVYLDVTVQNIAELDANSTDLNFFLTTIGGQLLETQTVPALCSQQTPLCQNSSVTFSQVPISNTGKIYATIGDGTNIRECPANNTDAAECSLTSPTEFVEIKYFIWRK